MYTDAHKKRALVVGRQRIFLKGAQQSLVVSWVDRDGRDQGEARRGRGWKREIGVVNAFSFRENHSRISVRGFFRPLVRFTVQKPLQRVGRFHSPL